MNADQIIGGTLAAAGIVGMCLWLALALAKAAGAKPRPRPNPPRKFYQCQQRGCTARATRIVLLITAATESLVVCDSDRDRLTITGRAVDLGPIFRGQA